MATATASPAARTRRRPVGPARTPELDAARTCALVAAVVVLVAPAPLPPWLAGPTGAAVHLPATFAVLAGAAVAHQRSAHAGAGVPWWSLRLLRRVAVLVLVGIALQVLARRTAPEALVLTGDLARLGVATALGVLLAGLPGRGRLLLATGLVAAHAWLVGLPDPSAGALAGWDARLLGGRALTPLDPDGPTAVAPTLALVLVGAVLGDLVRTGRRGTPTVARLGLVGAVAVAVAVGLGRVLPFDAALWSPPVLAGGTALACGLLAVGQAGTRRPATDRLVAPLAVAGRVALPLWAAAVLADAWVLDTRPVRWFLTTVLWPPLGDTGAAIALGLLCGAGLVRAGTALDDRGWRLRA